MKKRMISFLAAVLLLACLPLNAFAHEVPDETATGCFEITMMMGDKAIPGGKLICIRVGYIDEDDGNYFFCRLDGEKITDVSTAETAKETVEFIMDYQKKYPVSKKEKNIGKDGKVKFDDLEMGLYLISQENPPKGYHAISSFLVGVPNNEDGHYVYNLSIRSKAEPDKAPESSEPNPLKPSDSKLPQTGRINWPIPVLLATGLLLLVVGFLLYRGNKHEA